MLDPIQYLVYSQEPPFYAILENRVRCEETQQKTRRVQQLNQKAEPTPATLESTHTHTHTPHTKRLELVTTNNKKHQNSIQHRLEKASQSPPGHSGEANGAQEREAKTPPREPQERPREAERAPREPQESPEEFSATLSEVLGPPFGQLVGSFLTTFLSKSEKPKLSSRAARAPS